MLPPRCLVRNYSLQRLRASITSLDLYLELGKSGHISVDNFGVHPSQRLIRTQPQRSQPSIARELSVWQDQSLEYLSS